MTFVALVFLTALAAVIVGAVLLIQQGGWLAILAAILIVAHYIFTTMIYIFALLFNELNKKKEDKQA